MPQLSLYLDPPTMEALRAHAARENLSLSKYAGKVIGNHATDSWPDGFWDLYGALSDESFIEPKELNFTDDGPRASWD